MEKTIKNYSGNILIRKTTGNNSWIVEILHLWSKNTFGCVIGYWETRDCDGEEIAEFKVLHDRVMKIEYDNDGILIEAMRYGQKLADLIIKSN